MRQPDNCAPDPDFVRLVRGALVNLYDHAYLQNHPLVSKLGLDADLDRLTRAQELRRVLLEYIESLGPGTHEDSPPEATRAYAVLTYRYVDGMSMEEIGNELGLSQRSLYRAHRKGLRAVASLLWDKMRVEIRGSRSEPSVVPGAPGDRLEAVEAELNHLRPNVRLESLDLQVILRKVVDLLAPLMKQTGVRVIMSSPDAWPALMADRVVLRQVLVTLLSHALHSVQGDLTVTVCQEEGGSLVEISESPDVTRIRSRPLSSPQPNDPDLAVARALIEAQGGRLEILDRDRGWQARILLPSSDGATILVVEDNEDVVALFRRYLAGYRVIVVAATNGEQALRLATEMRPQVITLDVMIPGEDGWEILQRLKGAPETRHIPIVVCSVLNEPELALSVGASDYITKPVERIELLDVLQRHLGPLLPAA